MHSSPILYAEKSLTYVPLNVEPRHGILKFGIDGFVMLMVFECSRVSDTHCPGNEFCA